MKAGGPRYSQNSIIKVAGSILQTTFPFSFAYQTVCPVPLGSPFHTANTTSAQSTIYWFRFFMQSRVYCRCSIVSLSHLEAMEKYRSLSAAGQRTACRS